MWISEPQLLAKELIQFLLFNFPHITHPPHSLQQTDPQRSINTLSGWSFVWSQPLPVPSLKLQRRRAADRVAPKTGPMWLHITPLFQMWIQVGEIWTSEVQNQEANCYILLHMLEVWKRQTWVWLDFLLMEACLFTCPKKIQIQNARFWLETALIQGNETLSRKWWYPKRVDFLQTSSSYQFNAESVTPGNYDAWNVFLVRGEKITPKNVGLWRWAKSSCFFLRKKRGSLQENLRKKYLNLTDADGNARNALLVAS